MHCADNFFSRSLSDYESDCLDKCVLKFSNVNQRVMATSVKEQTIINDRRMKEMEQQIQTLNAATPETQSVVASPVTELATEPIQPVVVDTPTAI